MTYATMQTALPDPATEPRFYEGILTKRGLAWCVDIFIITLFTVLAGIATLTVAFWLWPIFFVGIGLIYRIATLAGGSATWGMRLMGIELRDNDGDRLGPLPAALHVFGYYASVAFFLPMLASLCAMVLTDRRQGLTDMLLGTAAINRPS